MRGFLFEIAESKENIGDLTADDFVRTRNGGSFAEWYEDLDKEEAIDMWSCPEDNYGIESGREEDGALYFVFAPDTKEKIFAKRFKCFQEEAARMTLEGFASETIYRLQMLIEDGYDDAVYLAEGQYAVTMDKFIRMVDPGRKYYVGNIVGMH